MIPQLEHLLKERDTARAASGFSFIKLHNGSAQTNPKVSFVAFAGTEPYLFLKTVRDPKDNPVIRHAHECLTRASMWVREAQLNLRLPEALWCIDVDPVVLSAETLIDGCGLHPDREDEVGSAFKLLEDWTRAGVARSSGYVDVPALFKRMCDEIGILSPEVRAHVERAYHEVRISAGESVRLPRIPAHGDCTPSNFLVDTHGRLGLIDWDRFGDIEIPLYDVLTLAERTSPKHANPIEVHAEPIKTQLKLLGRDSATLPLLIFLFVLATEWRKRAHLHPYEIEHRDQELAEYLKAASTWTLPVA